MVATAKTEDLIIVGAGPAGFSAAIYAKQAGFSPLVVRASEASLIATTDTVNNYLGVGNIGGMELWRSMETHFKTVCGEGASRLFTVQTICQNSDDTFTLTNQQGEKLHARAVIWAAGAKPKKLGFNGEDELESLSYCGVCDGDLFAGDPHLTVVGGGDTAAEEALYLAGLVDKITLLVRSELRSKAELTERIEAHSKIEIVRGVEVLEAAEIADSMELELKLNTGDSLTTSGLFVAIGHVPNSLPLAELAELDSSGFTIRSKREGFFIAGDIRGDNYRQAIIAAGDGAKAGIEAADYLRAL